jgi:hypothetical protein
MVAHLVAGGHEACVVASQLRLCWYQRCFVLVLASSVAPQQHSAHRPHHTPHAAVA